MADDKRPEKTYRPSGETMKRINWIAFRMQSQESKRLVLNTAIEEAMDLWLAQKEKVYGTEPAAEPKRKRA